jgi:hypothetical protein
VGNVVVWSRELLTPPAMKVTSCDGRIWMLREAAVLKV